MVFSPLYLVVMNWVFPFEISMLSDWILLWISEHLIYVLQLNTRGDNGVSYWFTWCMFWHSTRGFRRWHWGNLCIGVDARSRLLFSLVEILGHSLRFFVLDWVLRIWICFGVILVRTLDRSCHSPSLVLACLCISIHATCLNLKKLEMGMTEPPTPPP